MDKLRGKNSSKQAESLKKKPVKGVYISNPMKVKTSASDFRALVQELTGQDSDIADASRYSEMDGVDDDDQGVTRIDMATKDEENKGEASSTYSVSSTSIEKGGGKDTEIIYDSMNLLFKRILKANPILNETILSKCLKFCYLFPKSYEFYMDDLIHLWIALEFILPKEASNKSMEDTGRICFEEFTRMHIFQLSCPDSFTGRLRYTLNHSIFKLLQEDHDEGYAKQELKDIESPMSAITLHLSLCYSYTDQIAINLKNFQSAEGLCTLLILHDRRRSSGLNNVPWDFFQKFPGLWVLDMSHTNITELPSSIGCLKQLRYLNLSCTPVTTLPNSLCSLYQMQTLKLRGCLNLIGLPNGMSELINLRHLDMDVSCLLLSMPLGIGDLAELQTLAAFVVGTQNGCHITELKNLANLRGTLSILRLENTTSSKEAKEAALDKKKHILKSWIFTGLSYKMDLSSLKIFNLIHKSKSWRL